MAVGRAKDGAPRRRHARANREAIVEAAIVALAADPDASMAEVARAAGVVRRTVYAHFPSRQDLLEGIAEEAFAQLMAVSGQEDEASGDPAVALAELTLRIWPVGDRFRLLLSVARKEIGDTRIHHMLEPIRGRLHDIVERGRGDGRFSTYLPVEVLVATAEAVTLGHLEQANRGLITDKGETCAVTGLVLMGLPPEAAHRVVDGLVESRPANSVGDPDSER
ncbi:MAG: TetR/AcrR family transcriptional regulator [Rhodococcus sp.]|nr:TetR/AcrR family transcriptional regulator [Rhodococcus sp. (in: high G+C Gram-positive bacteria)]